MTTLFPRIKLPPTPSFRRPRDLTYASDECPPGPALITLSIQHIATSLALIAYILAAAKIGGLDIETTRKMVTATLLCMALTTFLQSWGGKFGSGLLLVQGPTSMLLPVTGMIIARYGVGGMVTVGLIYAVVGMAVSFLLPHLRALLPPVVAGIVLILAGLSLITPALSHIGMHADSPIDQIGILIGTVTLAVIVTLSVWGKRYVKLLAVLLGIIVGVALAALFGRLHGLGLLAAEPVIALPHWVTPVFGLDPGVLGAVVVLALMGQLSAFACIVLMHKMNDADWRRTDMRMVGRGIRANALGSFLTSWLGIYPCNTLSTNIAVNQISRSTSRWVGLLTGVLITVAAFLPQVSLALTLAPISVIGAVELYAAAYLIVSGIRLISSRAADSRGIFIIGLSIVIGAGVMLVPGLADMVPKSIQFMVHSGIVMGGLAAIALNLIFRLGVSQSARLVLNSDINETDSRSPGQQIVDFIEEHGASWGARQQVITLAAQAALEASEAIAAAGGQRKVVEILGRFDEFNLDIKLLHNGAPIQLQPQSSTVDTRLLDADDAAFDAALNRTIANVSHALLRRLADRLTSGTHNKYAFLHLHFDH